MERVSLHPSKRPKPSAPSAQKTSAKDLPRVKSKEVSGRNIRKKCLLYTNGLPTIAFSLFLRRPQPPAVPLAPPAAVPPRPAPRPPPAACRLASCRARAPVRAPAPSRTCLVSPGPAPSVCYSTLLRRHFLLRRYFNSMSDLNLRDKNASRVGKLNTVYMSVL